MFFGAAEPSRLSRITKSTLYRFAKRCALRENRQYPYAEALSGGGGRRFKSYHSDQHFSRFSPDFGQCPLGQMNPTDAPRAYPCNTQHLEIAMAIRGHDGNFSVRGSWIRLVCWLIGHRWSDRNWGSLGRDICPRCNRSFWRGTER